MMTKNYEIELITPCFCGGAEPDKRAEVRVPSIRGQLRWWFRTLGGFKSLNRSVRKQEDLVFGSGSGEEGTASCLILRVSGAQLSSAIVKDADETQAPMGSDRGYLLFPLRSRQERKTKRVIEYKGRALFEAGHGAARFPYFGLTVTWRGDPGLWPCIQSLISVFGHIGSLGFRSRRAMGALAFRTDPPDLNEALNQFNNPDTVCMRRLDASDADDAIRKAAAWLKQWRAHGRSIDHASAKQPDPPHNQGFAYAEKDHDTGVSAGQGRGNADDETFRPALGLPIIQFFSSGKPQIDWNCAFDFKKAKYNRKYRGEGRFASPFILRPHRDPNGKWHALVLFIDTKAWPSAKPVFLSSENHPGQKRRVSMGLYEAMKSDPILKPFP
jgi:CRISPR/Cas system CMR-associated protein Cmr1 (group 7 of RAMP superfamily)